MEVFRNAENRLKKKRKKRGSEVKIRNEKRDNSKGEETMKKKRKERELTLRIMLAWLNSYLFPRCILFEMCLKIGHTHTHTSTHIQRHIPLPGVHTETYTLQTSCRHIQTQDIMLSHLNYPPQVVNIFTERKSRKGLGLEKGKERDQQGPY